MGNYRQTQSHDIPVKSITYAMKGQRILERYGISSYVGRDRSVKSGCGYKLTVKGDKQRALEILRYFGIKLSEERREEQ